MSASSSVLLHLRFARVLRVPLTFHHRYDAELTAATAHRLRLAAAQGAVGITSDPTLTLVELLALAPHERKTHWAALDRSTKVAIVREHLTAKGKPFERADGDALVAALNARVGVVTSDDLADTADR